VNHHKNSTDQDFNNKGNRKLRPAKDSQENIDTKKPLQDPSSSLEELELLAAGEGQAVKTAPVSNHRRARSSLGGQRKSSANKKEGTINNSNRGTLLS